MIGMFRKGNTASDRAETYLSRMETGGEVENGESSSASESYDSGNHALGKHKSRLGKEMKCSMSATGSSHTEKDMDQHADWDWSAGKSQAQSKRDQNKVEASSSPSPASPTQDRQFDEIRVSRSRLIVLFCLSAAAAIVAFAIFHLASEQEQTGFQSKFEDAANQILEVIQINTASSIDFLNSWSLHITASVPVAGESWPFVTIPEFAWQGKDALEKTGARILSICPIVSSQNKAEWEQYSVTNQDWISDASANNDAALLNISTFIFRPVYPPLEATAPLYEDKYLPIWQTVPIEENQIMVNFDVFNYTVVPKVFESMMSSKAPVISETINAVPDSYGPPEAFLSVPLFESLQPTSRIVAVILAMMPWERYFANLIPQGTPPMVAVVSNPCTESFSYSIEGPAAIFMGIGDLHDGAFDSLETNADVAVVQSVQGCENTVYIYPTQEFQDTCTTNLPIIYTICAMCLFLLTAGSFYLYDATIRRRHKKIIKAATLSNALVSSLFPENVRSRIISEESQRQRSDSPDKPTMGTRQPSVTSMVEIPKGSKPIADLFPRATVLFADIAGFTAWSSSREPSQVFTLLESIYNSFDRIANRSKVFKVETIGDCYVAAAGLPDPRDDHAVIMARFAVQCMRRFREVVRDLEVSLGPDTADLALRAGLHSGPVTAGVLRGEKSRFQLFGDTVNVASRMESSGASNHIHISQATADLVISECDELSVRPREQMLEIKGKGKMQTYWLVSDDDPDPHEQKSEESNELDLPLTYTSFMGDSLVQTNRTPTALPACEKQKRLIDWNVDVLLGLLKKVVAMRSDESKKPTRKLAKLRIERENGEMVIDEVKEVIDIRGVKSNYKRDPESIELGSVVAAQLRDFVTVISQHYRPNHFHSFEHASHVTQSVIKLLGRIVAPEAIDYDNLTYRKKEDAVLHFYTYGITSDPLTQFAAAFSALIHDLDHKGVPNATLVKEQTEEAIRYKNKSVAEQNSVDLAWELLMKPEYVDLRACIYNSRKEFLRFRQLVVNAVMATDIVDKELKALRNKRWETAFATSEEQSTPDTTMDPLQRSAEDMNRKATIVIEHLIQASDVSHTMQHWHVYQKWNQRFFFECYQAYLDGRADVDPADGWYKGELGFFDFYIIPLAKKLKECGVFGVSSDEFLQYAESNRKEWEEKGHDLVDQYIAAYKEHVFGGFRRHGLGHMP